MAVAVLRTTRPFKFARGPLLGKECSSGPDLLGRLSLCTVLSFWRWSRPCKPVQGAELGALVVSDCNFKCLPCCQSFVGRLSAPLASRLGHTGTLS
eukprot:1494422-Amphidinium_carterae.3